MSDEPLDPVTEATRAQGEAAHPHVSVFVTANAGSGKTKVLVDRIARLLLEGSKPSAFLCITYTKAAAAEMQRRLFERLGGWCVADDTKLAAELKDLGANAADLPRARALEDVAHVPRALLEGTGEIGVTGPRAARLNA